MKKNADPPTRAELKKLQTHLERLTAYFDRKEMQGYLELAGKPRKLLWVNFMAGFARGIGMILGGGMIGTVVLGILVGIGAYVVHTLGGVPWLGEKVTELIANITAIVQRSSN